MTDVKRKSDHKSKSVSINIDSYSDEPSSIIGTFFNDLTVPNDTKFELFKQKGRDEFLLHGENDRLDYSGETNEDENNEYYIALYDPVRKLVDFHKAPIVQAKVTAKSKRKYSGPSVKQAGARNVDQRNALGKAFGTKKAKAAINNIERNKIDAEKLQDAELDIVDSVKTSTQVLPTKQEIEKVASSNRPIPEPVMDATNVEDIYPIHNIIPKKEWVLLRVGPLLSEPDIKKVQELLPYSKSLYVAKRLPSVLASKNAEKLQLLMYASLLFGVYENRRVKDKQTLMLRLQNKPAEALVDSIMERFTLHRASQFGKSKERSFVIDPHHENKLMCHLIAVLLHIDDFLIEIPPLIHELNMKQTRFTSLCKALGAIVKSPTAAQAEAYGVPKASSASYKIATLKVPFKLPELSKRGRRNG